jgi:hypothetical protein
MPPKKKYFSPEDVLNEHEDAPLPEPSPVEIPVVDAATFKATDPSAVLEVAAQTLCSALPDYVVMALERSADASHITMWQQILGLIVCTFKSGTIVSPDIDPAWLSGTPLMVKEAVCETCQAKFKPKSRGQRFCSNKCGIAEAERAFRQSAAGAHA